MYSTFSLQSCKFWRLSWRLQRKPNWKNLCSALVFSFGNEFNDTSPTLERRSSLTPNYQQMKWIFQIFFLKWQFLEWFNLHFEHSIKNMWSWGKVRLFQISMVFFPDDINLLKVISKKAEHCHSCQLRNIYLCCCGARKSIRLHCASAKNFLD